MVLLLILFALLYFSVLFKCSEMSHYHLEFQQEVGVIAKGAASEAPAEVQGEASVFVATGEIPL